MRRGTSLVVALLIAGASSGGDWPGWRGPTGMGLTEEKDLPLTWSAKTGENVLWKLPLPGTKEKARQDQNQSSPIAVRGRAFVTASYWPAAVDAKEYPEHHVACFDAAVGKPLWDTKVPPDPP